MKGSKLMHKFQKGKILSTVNLRTSFWVVGAFIIFSFTPLSTKIYEDIKNIEFLSFFKIFEPKEKIGYYDEDGFHLQATLRKPIKDKSSLEVMGLSKYFDTNGDYITFEKFDITIVFSDSNDNTIERYKFDEEGALKFEEEIEGQYLWSFVLDDFYGNKKNEYSSVDSIDFIVSNLKKTTESRKK